MSPTKTKVKGLVLLNEGAEKQVNSDARGYTYDILNEIAEERGMKFGMVDFEFEGKSPTELRAIEGDPVDLLINMRGWYGGRLDRAHYTLGFDDAEGVWHSVDVQDAPYGAACKDSDTLHAWNGNDYTNNEGEPVGSRVPLGWFASKLLYVPWRVRDEHRTDDHRKYVKMILESGIDAALDADEEAWKNEAKEKLVTTMIETLKANKGSRLDEVEQLLAQTRATMNEAMAQQMAAEERIAELEPEANAIRENTVNEDMLREDEVMKVIEQMEKLPHVVEVGALMERGVPRPGALKVVTDTLENRIFKEGVEYATELGAFEIRIYFDKGDLRAINLSGGASGYYHPHIDTSGHWCLAGMARLTRDLIRSYDYVSCVGYIIDQLQVTTSNRGYDGYWNAFEQQCGYRKNVKTGEVTWIEGHANNPNTKK